MNSDLHDGDTKVADGRNGGTAATTLTSSSRPRLRSCAWHVYDGDTKGAGGDAFHFIVLGTELSLNAECCLDLSCFIALGMEMDASHSVVALRDRPSFSWTCFGWRDGNYLIDFVMMVQCSPVCIWL